MNYARVRAALHQLTIRAVLPGLARTRKLLAYLGHPDAAYPAVQITGTNGKGSVAALLSAVLTQSGYRVGCFTSPHLQDERERITLNGKKVSQRAFAAAGQKLLPGLKALQQAGTPATTFEAWTVLAAEVFRQDGIDLALVEAGMGGRLDATSAGKRVILSILTNIGLEHTRELGNSLSAICGEKIAIARKGVPLLSAEAHPGIRGLMRAQARERIFPIEFAGMNSKDAVQVKAWKRTPKGLQIELIVKQRDLTCNSPHRVPPLEKGVRGILQIINPVRYPATCCGENSFKIHIPWQGEFQVLNAALAFLAMHNLQKAGYQISGEDICQGFKCARWPGRMEIVSQKPKIYLDGAHNPAAVRALIREWHSRSEKVYLVAGIVRDKDVKGMCREFVKAAKTVWTVAPPDPRALPAKELAECFQAAGVKAEPQRSFRLALQKAVQAAGIRGTVLVAGSLYNIAPARRALGRLKSLNLITL